MVLFDHLHIWIVGQAVFANRGEICCLPTRLIQVLLYLWRRHGCETGNNKDLGEVSVG